MTVTHQVVCDHDLFLVPARMIKSHSVIPTVSSLLRVCFYLSSLGTGLCSIATSP